MNKNNGLKAIVILIFLTCSIQTHATEKYVTISNLEGKKIKVELLDKKEGIVFCKFPQQSKQMSIPFESLDSKSQELINAWVTKGGNLSKKLRISNVKMLKEDAENTDFETRYNNRNLHSKLTNGKHEKVTPTFTIRNQNKFKASSPMKAKIIVFNFNVASRNISHEIETIQIPSIPADGNTQISGTHHIYSQYTQETTVNQRVIDSNNQTTFRDIKVKDRAGNRFKDYVIYLLDQNDVIIDAEATRAAMITEHEKLITQNTFQRK